MPLGSCPNHICPIHAVGFQHLRTHLRCSESIEGKQTSYASFPTTMAYMFFLLQITPGAFLIQQRLVSNRIENILKAEPSFCPMKRQMVRQQ